MAAPEEVHAAMLALYKRLERSVSPEELERGDGVILGAEDVRRVVREELDQCAKGLGQTQADRLMRGVDNRIDQFLARHLKSKELAERIGTISRSEARLTHAACIERLKADLEAKVGQEVEKAVDDLLRSEALADRIRRVAREAVATALPSSTAASA